MESVNYLDILKDKNSSEREEEIIIEKAYDSSKRMQKMIEHLLLLSQLNKDEVIDKKLINMQILIDNVLSDLQAKIEETKAMIKIKNELHDVPGDENLIRQLFLNFINNSIKYCDKNTPVIEISSLEKENQIEYNIVDNGIGISKKDIDKYFNSPSVWDNPSSLKGGMGVAICRRIIFLHHGEMWVESKEGSGTKIFFSIPK